MHLLMEESDLSKHDVCVLFPFQHFFPFVPRRKPNPGAHHTGPHDLTLPLAAPGSSLAGLLVASRPDYTLGYLESCVFPLYPTPPTLATSCLLEECPTSQDQRGSSPLPAIVVEFLTLFFQ